jgi:hypothetical protein
MVARQAFQTICDGNFVCDEGEEKSIAVYDDGRCKGRSHAMLRAVGLVWLQKNCGNVPGGLSGFVLRNFQGTYILLRLENKPFQPVHTGFYLSLAEFEVDLDYAILLKM